MFRCHLIAILLGTIFELYLGDNRIFLMLEEKISSWIFKLENIFLGNELVLLEKTDREEYGTALILIILLPTAIIAGSFQIIFYKVHPVMGVLFEMLITSFCLNVRHTRANVKVFIEDYYDSINPKNKNILKEKFNSSDIRKSIEATADTLSDGFLCPMFYLFIGGPALGIIYYVTNLLDRRIGYHNERYEDFGKSAAKLDDILNYVPSRIAGVVTVFASKMASGNYFYDGINANYIFLRDRKNNLSPNSGMTEAAVAGALNIRLGNEQKDSYNVRPYIGDSNKEIEILDLSKALSLLYFIYFFVQIMLLILIIIF